jgi:hypothetical protein
MAAMPRGEPRTVPDPAGELYNREMAKIRAKRIAAVQQASASPLDHMAEAFKDFQEGPDIPRPSTAQTFIPVVGPAWEAVGNIEDGQYGKAAFNGAMMVADALPVGVALKGTRSLAKGIGILKGGSVTADASRKAIRAAGLSKHGQEVHHTIPLRGLGRNTQDPRNHFALLKVMPKEQHRRLTGSWAGKPKYGPIGQVWYGTTDWMKAVPTGVGGYLLDTGQNLAEPPRSRALPPK